jgi:hypothetical protein
MDVNKRLAIAVVLIVLAILLCLLLSWAMNVEKEGCGRVITRCDTVRLIPPSNLQVYKSGNWIASWYLVPDAKSYEVSIVTTSGTTKKTVTGTTCEFDLTASESPPEHSLTVMVVAKLDECNLKSNPSVLTIP